MQLNTLGSLRLSEGNFTRSKPLLLLAYLVLEGPTPRRRLAELFFRDTKDAADALSTTLRRLRNSPDVTLDSSDGLLSCPMSCDAKRLLELMDAGELDGAISMYRAPFLASLDLPLSTELEEWIYATREFIAGRLRRVTISAAETALVVNDRTAAARYAEIAMTVQGAPELEPDEARLLHRVLGVTNRARAEQLRRDAAGVGIHLAQSPLNGPRERAESVPGVPAPLASLVGRDLELLEIANALANPECRLLCLHGPGGIGKTRLAMQVAYDARSQGVHSAGVFVVSLETLARPTQVPHAIAAATATGPLTSEDPWAELGGRLGSGRRLLLLDNFEHVAEAAAHLSGLLRSCPGLTLLVTSRERLNVSAEWVLTLDGLPVPADDMGLEGALTVDALSLLVRRMKRADLSFALDEADLPHAIAICRRVDGFPLGLELAAGWIKVMRLQDVAAALARDPSSLETTLGDVTGRHRSLGAALEGSWTLLGDRDQEVLRALSVLRGGFRREAAAAVAGASITNLASLVDKSMIRPLPNGRFGSHALLQQFAREKLAERPAEEAAVLERHGEYYGRLLTDTSAKAGTADFQELFALLEEEEGNVLACLDWAVAGRRAEVLLALSDPLLWYFPMRGRFHEGAAIFARAIANLDEHDAVTQEALASLALGQSFLARYSGDLAEAMALAVKAERMARASSSSRQLVRVLNVLGQAVTFTGRYGEARDMLEEAVTLARLDADVTLLFRGLGNLIVTLALVGEYEQASVLADEALEILEGGAVAEGFEALGVLLAVGALRSCMEDWLAASEVLDRAAVMADAVGYQGSASVIKALLANALLRLGAIRSDAGLVRRAARHNAEGMALAAVSREAMARSLLYGNQARLALMEGAYREAERLALQAVSVAWRNHNLTIVFWTLPVVLECLLVGEKVHEANRLIRLIEAHEAAPRWVKAAAERLREEPIVQGNGGPFDHGASGAPSLEATLEDLLAGHDFEPA